MTPHDDPNYRLKRLAKWKFADLILFEDEHMLAINKPQGIATLGERWSQERSLADAAREYSDDLRAAHRLDKHTTGVLIYARHAEAYRNLALQFQEREVHKEYLALVKGNWQFDGFEVDAAIAQGNRGLVRIDPYIGKPSLTVFHTEKQWRDYTLLRAEPETGRSHQIRIHLAHIHSPIVGDEVYGGSNLYVSELKRRGYQRHPDQTEQPLNTAYVLHCHRLGVHHPHTDQPLLIEAPLSANMAVCIRQLDKYNAVL